MKIKKIKITKDYLDRIGFETHELDHVRVYHGNCYTSDIVSVTFDKDGNVLEINVDSANNSVIIRDDSSKFFNVLFTAICLVFQGDDSRINKLLEKMIGTEFE